MPQTPENDEGIGESLANRVKQSAAIAEMRAEESAPPKKKDTTVYPQDKVTSRPAPKGEQRISSKDIGDWTKLLPTQKPPVYDDGGKVDVNDGKHQIAIVKDGERVLTPSQNKAYEKDKGISGVDGKAPTKLPIGGKTARDWNDVTPEIKPTPKAPLYDKGGNVEHTKEEKAHFARGMSHLHQGALHRHFGIAEDQPIPMEKKQEAANSDNPHVAAMGRMAVAMHGWKKGKK